MVAKAEGKYLRISPFKVRPVIRLVKGANAVKATYILASLNKKAAFLLGKILKSAVANAKLKGFEPDKLFISKALANAGPVLKRYHAASFGRAMPIVKRMAHVLVELDTQEKMK